MNKVARTWGKIVFLNSTNGLRKIVQLSNCAQHNFVTTFLSKLINLVCLGLYKLINMVIPCICKISNTCQVGFLHIIHNNYDYYEVNKLLVIESRAV
jgi:hypothetical protein